MQISQKQLEKFIKLYEKHFGVQLDMESASEKGRKLVDTLQVILKEHAKHRKEISKP